MTSHPRESDFWRLQLALDEVATHARYLSRALEARPQEGSPGLPQAFEERIAPLIRAVNTACGLVGVEYLREQLGSRGVPFEDGSPFCQAGGLPT